MKKILFITSALLDDPKRGTPIRIRNFIKQIEKENNVVIYHVSHEKNFWSQIFQLRRVIKKNRPDMAMTATDVDIDFPFWLKILTGVKIAIDLHGLNSAEMYFHGHMGKWKSWLLQQKINFQIRFFDLVFVVSPKLLDFYGPKIKQGVVIYGGVTDDDFYNGPIKSPEIFTIGYTGNFNPYQGIDEVLIVAGNIRRQNLFPFRLNLILSNGQKQVEDRLKELNLSDITDLRFKVSHDEVPELMAKSSVLIIARPSVPMTEYAFPSKLPEYLATGIPVITTKVGPVEALLSDKDCALIISPDNVLVELEEELVFLSKMTVEERNSLGQKAVKLVRQSLTWDTIGHTINQSLKNI